MVQGFIIRGKLPSLNEYIRAERGNRYGGASMKKEHQMAVEMIIRAARLKRYDVPVTVHFAFYEETRRRDFDNISSFAHKVIMDALTRTGVIIDDGWRGVKGYEDEFYLDPVDPRIEVTVIS